MQGECGIVLSFCLLWRHSFGEVWQSSIINAPLGVYHASWRKGLPSPYQQYLPWRRKRPLPTALTFCDKSIVHQEVARCLLLPFLNNRPLGISACYYTMRNVGWGRRQCNWNVKGLSSSWFEGWPKAQIASYFKQTVHNIYCHFVGNMACCIWLVQAEMVPTLGAEEHPLYYKARFRFFF